jgi:hypothetical protein
MTCTVARIRYAEPSTRVRGVAFGSLSNVSRKRPQPLPSRVIIRVQLAHGRAFSRTGIANDFRKCIAPWTTITGSLVNRPRVLL